MPQFDQLTATSSLMADNETIYQFKMAAWLLNAAARSIMESCETFHTKDVADEFSEQGWPRSRRMIDAGYLYADLSLEDIEDVEPIGDTWEEIRKAYGEYEKADVEARCAMATLDAALTRLKSAGYMAPQDFVVILNRARELVQAQ